MRIRNGAGRIVSSEASQEQEREMVAPANWLLLIENEVLGSMVRFIRGVE